MVDAAKPGTVQSLTRALELMKTLALVPQGLSLKDIAAQNRLPPSTAHRLLTTLSENGFATMAADCQKWRIGVEAFAVGQSFLAGRDLIQTARAPMVRLMEETQETVKIGLLVGTQVVILTQSECSQPMRAFAEPGTSLPLYCTSLGKALLAAQGQAAAKTLLGDAAFTALTSKTLPDFPALWANISATYAHGYAVQDEEYREGLRGAAACIFDEHGAPAAALSVTGPSVRIPSDRLDQLGVLVARVCQGITQEYGGKRPAIAA